MAEERRYANGKTEKQVLLQRYDELKTQRNNYDPEWKEIVEFIQPRRGRFHQTEKGQRNRSIRQIINSRGIIASRTLASGLMSGLTSPARPWFKIGTPDPELMKARRVQDWLDKLEKRISQVFSMSNLYQVLPSVYMELGLFGTACLGHFDDDEHIARFYPFTVGTYVLSQTDRLVVDTLGREMRMTVRQMADKFGFENMSSMARSLYERDQLDADVTVMQFIGPNYDHVPGSDFAKDLPYQAVYCERGGVYGAYGGGYGGGAYATDGQILGREGFYELPFYAPRWEVTSEDVYGTMCPGMAALGDVKGLQELEKEKAIAIEKHNDPPLQGPSSLKNVPVENIPGGATIYNQDGQGGGGLSTLYQTNPAVQELEMAIQAHEARIDQAFYADLFRHLDGLRGVQPRNELELLQREQEKLLQLGPLLERVQGDLLGPLIDRTANQVFRAGLMPDPPEELVGLRLKTTYISPLAVAQRQSGTETIDRVVRFVSGLAGFDPSVVDIFNPDAAVREYQVLIDAPAKILRDAQEVQEIRERRAAQQEAMRQAQLDQANADAAQKLGAVA